MSPATSEKCRTVHVPIAILAKLAPAAKRRGMRSEMLAYLILEMVADEGLVDAVLDDADTEARAA